MRGMAAAERPAPAVPRGRHAPPLEVRLTVQRRRLFEAAADVFARVGYAEASAEAISREAGMSKATFYEHFANKEECILALFDEAATEVMRAMSAASDDGGHASYEERVAAGVHAFLATLASYPTSAQTLLVQIIGAGPRAAARRDAILEAFADSLYRDNQRAAPQYGAPTFASPDDAFAVIGASVELVSRSLRTGRPPDVLALEPVITRLMLGVLHRA
jgi:AcrR family transcriptional regulator